jgi:cell division protein FtsW
MRFSDWFNSIDSKLFIAICLLMVFGFIMTLAASPAVAERISVNQFHFINKQIIYFFIALFIITILSAINEKLLLRFIFTGFILTVIMLVAVLFFGEETKGARRWLNIAGFSLQPAELLKPFYSSIIAMLLATHQKSFASFCLLIIFHMAIISLLLMQPDFGMAILISTIFSIQLFVAEINLLWLIGLSIIFIFGSVIVYYLFAHVAKRIEKFLASGDGEIGYQIKQSLQSYYEGGLWGKGPGEGTVKFQLPDAHTDFIFPVAAEELGVVFCLFMICIMSYIIIKGFINIFKIKYSRYKVFMGSAVIGYFAVQSIFNIAVTLNLVPTKGMTLPFISYGGSSLIAQAILFGIFLNMTKDLDKAYSKAKPIHVRI